MICESRGLESRACQSSGSMYNNVADSVFPMLTLQSAAQVSLPVSAIPGMMMAQDFQQYEVLNGGLMPQVDFSSNSGRSKPRGLWCYGIQSDVAKEWSFQLNKNGLPEPKLAAEAAVEGGQVVVRSQSCPWSSMNVNNTNRNAATDPICFQRIVEDALPPDTCRRPGSHDQGWCKYCATLERELMYSLEVKEKLWDDDNSWEDVSFKQVDQYFESRTSTSSLAQQDSRKRKYGLDDWENDRSLVLLKLNELNTRATRAEQRVVEFEQLLRDHALVALDETCDDSDIVTSASRHDCFNEGQSEMLICKIAGCNKSFKSSKTLRRHVLQKHSDNARFLVCNQPTVNGLMCRFKTIHSGVLSYHRKHSLAHQRREDWHMSCPFCQSKFARQHEMERHRRICKSRPAPHIPTNSMGSSVQSTTMSEPGLNHLHQMPGASFVVPERGHNSLFTMPESNCIESSITY